MRCSSACPFSGSSRKHSHVTVNRKHYISCWWTITALRKLLFMSPQYYLFFTAKVSRRLIPSQPAKFSGDTENYSWGRGGGQTENKSNDIFRIRIPPDVTTVCYFLASCICSRIRLNWIAFITTFLFLFFSFLFFFLFFFFLFLFSFSSFLFFCY